MRAKTVAIIALLVCAGEAVYLLWPKTAPPAPMVVEKSVIPPETVAPVVAEEPVLPEPVAEAPPPALPVPEPEAMALADPQAEPRTAIAELLRVIREGDPATLIATFMPPSAAATMTEERKARTIEEMRTALTPGSPAHTMMQLMIQGLELIQGTEPTYNEAGDRATYPMDVVAPEGMSMRLPKTLVLTREEGRWYMK